MSTLALRRPRPPERDDGRPAPSLFDGVGGEPTLDELLAGAWEGLAAHRSVSCPVCGEGMKPVYGAHALEPDDSGAARTGAGRGAGRVPEGGRCVGCETELS